MDWHPRVYRKDQTQFKQMKREEWRILRRQCLEKDNYSCYRCGKHSKSGKGLSTHHLIPRKDGGLDELRNLITLCEKCHDLVEMRDYRTLQEIERSSAELSTGEMKIDPKPGVDEDPYNRPDWHAWVYGGARNPIMDRKSSPGE